MNAPLVPVPAESLVAAYAATDFLVLALRPVTLRVDQVVAGLDDWLRAQRCESAVVISARRPFSQALAEDEEDRRHEELHLKFEVDAKQLTCKSFSFWPYTEPHAIPHSGHHLAASYGRFQADQIRARFNLSSGADAMQDALIGRDRATAWLALGLRVQSSRYKSRSFNLAWRLAMAAALATSSAR